MCDSLKCPWVRDLRKDFRMHQPLVTFFCPVGNKNVTTNDVLTEIKLPFGYLDCYTNLRNCQTRSIKHFIL